MTVSGPAPGLVPGLVLVTRPEPGLGETLAALTGRGYRPVAAPLLSVRPLRPRVPARVQAILLTSGQAASPLAAAASHLRAVRLLAVGDATARRARLAGFEHVESAAGDADALEALATDSLATADGPLLLACGLGQGMALTRSLRRRGYRVVRRCLYAAEPAGALPEPAVEALRSNTLQAALFFSGETATAFARLLPPALRPALRRVRALAISDKAAAPLGRLAWAGIEIATAPTATSLLDLL